MAKISYKIPDTLDKSFGDVEIAIQNNDGMGLKPLPVKVVLSYVVSFFLCCFLLFKTFINDGTIWMKILFVVVWVVMSVILFSYDKTKQMQISTISTLLHYLPKRNRYVLTRESENASDFYRLLGVEDIDTDKGLITFADGTFGYMYRVVGSGSILLFDEDREAILDRVDAFYRKMKTDYEIIYITSREAQKVYRQIANLKKRYDALDENDFELRAVANMEHEYLKDYVGTLFRSIHQYMIIKADNQEALMVGKNMLQSEVENSSLMIKQCTALFDDDIYDVYRSVYRGKESV